MDNNREELYNFIVDHFSEWDYQQAIDQDQDEEPEAEGSFTDEFRNYEQFKTKQLSQVNQLPQEDLIGLNWLMFQIRTGEISMVDKESMHRMWGPDGFYLFHGRFILTHPR